jgi:L-threonylcarbamoyladenylate synthase
MTNPLIQTKILTDLDLEEAVSLLKNGEVVALPTETVYGLAADAKNSEAITKIFISKGRPSEHPLIVHVDTLARVSDWAKEIPEDAKKLAKSFWPGPLTMIFAKKNDVLPLITGGLPTVAVRIPNHAVTLEIIKKLGNGIVAPSANAHKKTSPTKPEHVLKTLEGKIAALVDGGTCSVGIESTIIDMSQEVPVILRPGAITKEMIEKVLGITVQSPLKHNEKVSGNMEFHYQPEKPLYLMSRDEIEKLLLTEDGLAIMHYSNLPQSNHATYYRMPTNKTFYAQALYTTLHSIDNTDVKKIIVEKPPFLSEWSDINDRLIKAASKQ